MAHFDDICGYCLHMESDLDLIDKGKFPCTKLRTLVFADSKKCEKFCEILWRDSDKSEAAIAETKKYKRSIGCYITTAVCKILGYEEDCHELTVLKEFRATVMETNPKYANMILKYEALAPVIANWLLAKNDKDLAKVLYSVYIKGTCKYIECGNDCVKSGLGDCGYYDAAINLYEEMTRSLIDSEIERAVIPGFDTTYEQDGDGQKRIKFEKRA